MTLPDNRIRLQAPEIDFVNQVGVTGLSHDSYPSPGDQARYDHQRMYLIGLLSQQSSFDEPTERRDGTPWFDLNTLSLKIWSGSEWKLYSEVVTLAEDATGSTTTLKEWFDSVSSALAAFGQEITFSGSASADTNVITVPSSLQSFLYADSVPYVYVNGLLRDPRNTKFDPIPTIKLVNNVKSGESFTVIIRRVPSTSFYVPSVSIP